MPNPVSFRYFKTSPEFIQLAVMMYIQFTLSLRNVEDLLYELGLDASYESFRYWWVCPKGCSRVLGFQRLFDRGHTVAATHIRDVEFHAGSYLVLKFR